MSVLPVGFGSSGVDTGDIGHSLRFRGGATPNLSRVNGSPATSTTKRFLSMWVKRGQLDGTTARHFLYYAGLSSLTGNMILLEFAQDKLRCFYDGAAATGFTTTQVFRDPLSHFHIALAYDSTKATAADRSKLWINGVLVTAYDAFNSPALNQAFVAGASDVQYFGSASYPLDGYLSRLCVVDNPSGVTPSSFGYQNSETNAWVSKTQSQVKAVVDAGGTNSFMLDFDDATSLTTLGYDKSSKGNNWTLNNFSLTAGSTYDWMLDVPGNSYATWNPLDTRASGVTFSAGNLQMAYGTSAWRAACSSIVVDSGKWYAEADVTQLGSGTALLFGCSTLASLVNGTNLGDWTGAIGIGKGTSGAIFASQASYPAAPQTLGANDRNLCAIDVDAGKAWLGYYDSSVPSTTWYSSTGAATGNPETGANPTLTFTAGTPMVFAQSIYNTSTAYAAYFGASGVVATQPTGFLALCQANLPDPAIPNPEKQFEAKTRTGTGAAGSVSGLLFAPGLVWSKSRSNLQDHELYDIVRGATKYLLSDTTSAEGTAVQGLTAFNSDGFSFGNSSGSAINISGQSIIDWLWKAGGAAVTNNSGSISSQVSANVLAGQSVLTYTSPNNAADQTVGHGLTSAPELIIAKNRTSATLNWDIYHKALAAGYGLKFATDASSAGRWPTTAPTSSVFSTKNTYEHNSTDTYVAYCFHSVPGYSKISSYVGNGSADGPYVECGFKPKYVLYKRTDAAANWAVFDVARNSANPENLYLLPNSSAAEGTLEVFDFTASGFKVRTSNIDSNASGGTYIFYAIADVPGKYSLAR